MNRGLKNQKYSSSVNLWKGLQLVLFLLLCHSILCFAAFPFGGGEEHLVFAYPPARAEAAWADFRAYLIIGIVTAVFSASLIKVSPLISSLASSALITLRWWLTIVQWPYQFAWMLQFTRPMTLVLFAAVFYFGMLPSRLVRSLPDWV